MRPTLRRAAGRSGGGIKLRLNDAENRLKRTTHGAQRGDRCNRNEAGNQAVLDGGGTGLVPPKLANGLVHVRCPFHGRSDGANFK